MMQHTSSFPKLTLLDSLQDFQQHVVTMAQEANRELYILSTDLDFPLYDSHTFCQPLSELARRSPHVRIQILVKQTKPLIERGHLVLELSRKLPTKIGLRKLTLEPQDNTAAYMIVDRERLLYKNDDSQYSGFANYAARPEAEHLLKEFQYLWEKHSREDTQLRRLSL